MHPHRKKLLQKKKINIQEENESDFEENNVTIELDDSESDFENLEDIVKGANDESLYNRYLSEKKNW